MCLSTREISVTITSDALDLNVQLPHQTWDFLPRYWHLVTITGDLLKLVHWRTPPPRVTSGGGHWSTYRLQAGGAHLTGMRSCFTECPKPPQTAVQNRSSTIETMSHAYPCVHPGFPFGLGNIICQTFWKVPIFREIYCSMGGSLSQPMKYYAPDK